MLQKAAIPRNRTYGLWAKVFIPLKYTPLKYTRYNGIPCSL